MCRRNIILYFYIVLLMLVNGFGSGLFKVNGAKFYAHRSIIKISVDGKRKFSIVDILTHSLSINKYKG